MRGGRGDPIQLWIGLAALSALVAASALTLSLAVSGAAVVLCLVILGVFGLLTLVLVYIAIAAHYECWPFREPSPVEPEPLKPFLAVTGPEADDDPPLVEPSLEGLNRRLEQLKRPNVMRPSTDHVVPPSERAPED